jgi:tetratricopeptide (TPR) repeat protein
MKIRRFPRRFLLLLAGLAGLTTARADTGSLDAAIGLFKNHRVPEAREILVTLAAREPDNIQALWYLGRADTLMQRREEAILVLEHAMRLAPGDHHILADYGSACLLRASELGVSFKGIGYARRGRDALEHAVQLAPDEIAYREGLVEFYKHAPAIVGGGLAKAYDQAAEIARRNPLRGGIIKASIQAYDRHFAEARATCEEALRTDPDNYLALYTLGRIASESGEGLEQGEQALRHCLHLQPAAQEPDIAGVHFRLGLIAEKSGRPADARAEYQTALQLEPAFQQAIEALARLK